jgi:hypothetical protein
VEEREEDFLVDLFLIEPFRQVVDLVDGVMVTSQFSEMQQEATNCILYKGSCWGGVENGRWDAARILEKVVDCCPTHVTMDRPPAQKANGTSMSIVEQIVLTLDLAAQLVLFCNRRRDLMALQGLAQKGMALFPFHSGKGRVNLKNLMESKLIDTTMFAAFRSKNISCHLSHLEIKLDVTLEGSVSCRDSSLMSHKSWRSTAGKEQDDQN